MSGRIVNVRPKPGFVMDGQAVVPSSNVVPMRVRDSFLNAMAGTGTVRDIRSGASYLPTIMTRDMIDAAYRGSGIVQKIIQVVPLDMVREWRDWSGGDAKQLAALFDEEDRLGIRQKVYEAEVLRGLGGAALVLGLPQDPEQPAPDTVGKGGLAFIHVVSRHHLTFDELQNDATKDGYGHPVMWKMQTSDGERRIHPSRVIPFRADTTTATGSLHGGTAADAYWGQPKIAQIIEAARDFDGAFASFAALIHKARLLRIGIPNLYELIIGGEWQQVSERLAALATAESAHNATIFDAGNSEGKGGEDIQDATYSFAGVKDMLNAYGERLCAVADIPSTRLLGRAPEGMNSSGDSQQRDWDKKVAALQDLQLGPCIKALDRYLVPSAIGTRPPELAYDWAPLDTPGEKEKAETLLALTQAIENLQASATIPERAFSEGVQSVLVERGDFPALESALAKLSDEERYGLASPDGNSEEGGDPVLEGEAGGEMEAPPLRRAANDAAPRPLYVRRQLLNAADLVAWAKANSFDATLPAEDMHVTVLYSKQPVDPIKMGEAWGSEQNGDLIVKAGGPRALERFNEGAVVLQFASWSLVSRHNDMVREGASHDWPEYLPHVTITYAGSGVDLTKIAPFTGELHFGPEIFEPLDEDWKSKIEEE